MSQQKLKLLLLLNNKHTKIFKDLQNEWGKYFNLDTIYDKPENISKYTNNHVIHILFLDDTSKWRTEFYDSFKKVNNLFSYTSVKNKPLNASDIKDYKMQVDRIIYTERDTEVLKWHIISALRRYWDYFSNNSTIFHENIIADFVENKFSVNKKIIKLTSMESKLLRIFMTNIDKQLSKADIFQKVWGHDDEDVSRNFDQMFFKLKAKIGKEHFIVKRNKGITFK